MLQQLDDAPQGAFNRPLKVPGACPHSDITLATLYAQTYADELGWCMRAQVLHVLAAELPMPPDGDRPVPADGCHRPLAGGGLHHRLAHLPAPHPALRLRPCQECATHLPDTWQLDCILHLSCCNLPIHFVSHKPANSKGMCCSGVTPRLSDEHSERKTFLFSQNNGICQFQCTFYAVQHIRSCAAT